MDKGITIVGVTGGIASGKSLVLRTFIKLGAYAVDCDVVCREVVLPCTKAWWDIVHAFGKGILRRDLAINREKLRGIVFSDPEKLRRLERIIHPEVRRKCRERVEAIKRLDQNALVVIDVPLLIETGMQEEFDTVIVVYVREDTQIQRLMERDGVTKEAAKRMIELQMPLSDKLNFADTVITNEGTKEETENQVRTVFDALSSG